MLRERLRAISKINAVFDLGVTTLSFLLAYLIKDKLLPIPIRGLFPIRYYWWLLIVILPVWAFWLHHNRTYFTLERLPLKRIWMETSKSVVEGMAIVLASIFLRKAYLQSRLFVLIFGIVNLILLNLEKTTLHWIVRKWKGPYQQLLIVGTGERARSFCQVVSRHLRHWGIEVVGFLRLPGDIPKIDLSLIIGDSHILPAVLQNRHIDWVVFSSDQGSSEAIEEGVRVCRVIGVDSSYLLSGIHPFGAAPPELELYERLPLLTYRTISKSHWVLLAKDVIDKFTSFILLSISIPLFLVIGIAIKLSSKGPVFFRQTRCGLNGRRFTLYKFRTMREGAEELHQEMILRSEVSGPVFKLRRDPRATKVGELLRRSSLDELPQLFNVLKGNMSLVGPRPPLASEVEKYEIWQRRRLSMKPGLTCVWQTSGRCEIDFDRWMELDLEYIDSWSLWLDLKIALRTIPAILSGRGAY